MTTTIFFYSIEIFIDYLYLIVQSYVKVFQTNKILLSFFVPLMIYSNPHKDKSLILSDLKGKTGIYMWIHKESSRVYVGSPTDLSIRLGNYYSPS